MFFSHNNVFAMFEYINECLNKKYSSDPPKCSTYKVDFKRCLIIIVIIINIIIPNSVIYPNINKL